MSESIQESQTEAERIDNYLKEIDAEYLKEAEKPNMKTFHIPEDLQEYFGAEHIDSPDYTIPNKPKAKP